MTAIAQLDAIKRVPGDWYLQGSCRRDDVDKELFFHPEGERGNARRKRARKAATVCSDCPVAALCLEYGRAAREPYGVWGGESQDERKAFLAGKKPGDPSLNGAGPAAFLPVLERVGPDIPRSHTGSIVDATAARQHVQGLLDQGYSVPDVSEAAGIAVAVVRKIAAGAPTATQRAIALVLGVRPEASEVAA